MVRDELKNRGYDKEAEYFKRQEQEALEKLRQKQAEKKEEKPDEQQAE
ncbi:hypothetical protein [Acanthopleuribacter pedis]|uniref:Uncharacterized protein n=1 Tax=Acanthopleuribacter pedis TaxID=442870 RepID=A0A8J7U7R7_9BACT|nr:hypothetical protein [Acanthopleuribacter pedis]MBO1321696.1 hypothetical protein [Acanthopleuribacter pedis]